MKAPRLATRFALISSVALPVLASPAFAADAAATAASTPNLEEIVVTANKREENLQQAPVAITAIPASQLSLRQLSETKDLSGIAPNVSVVGATTNATASVVTIRGIPTAADETQGYDSPIGIYLDGVYLARSSASTFNVADIERVEVLRGPQGTLFGRNTTGGALNFITKKPSKDASGKVEFTAGNYGLTNGKVIVNSGDIGGVRMSIGYFHGHRDGVVENPLVPGKSQDPGSNTTDSFRFAADITNPGGNLEIYNVFDYTKIRAAAYVMQLAAVGNGTVIPNVTLNGQTFATVQPTNVAGYLAETTSLNPACPNTVTRAYQSTVCDPTAGQSVDKLWGDMLRIELKLGGMTLRSTSSYRQWDNHIPTTDLDGLGPISGPVFNIGNPALPAKGTFIGMPASILTGFGIPSGAATFLTSGTIPKVSQPLFAADNTRGQDQISQELELVSDNKGPLQWVLGGFYFKEHGYETNNQSIGFVLDTNQLVYTPAAMTATLVGFGFPAGTAGCPTPAGTAACLGPQLAAALQAANPARYRVLPTPSTLAYTTAGESIAVYGQAAYRPGGEQGKLGVTLGLRYTWDRKAMTRTQNGAAPLSAVELPFNTNAAKFNAPTGNLTIDYRATDSVNLYARAARGYRSGGFNARAATSSAANLGLTPFNDEKIWSYEIGAKMEFMHRFRLNLAAFHNVYTDQQITVPVPIVGGGSFGTQTINAGKSTYDGFEVEALAKVNDYLTLDGNFGYIDIKIKDFTAFDTTGKPGNIASLIIPGAYAPKYTLNLGATVTYPIGSNTLTARLGYNYTSSFIEFGNTLTAPFSAATAADARGLLDGQIKLDGLIGNHASLTLWGKNLTDKHYVVRSVDFGQLGFGTVIYADPRTFGATLGIKF